VNRLEAYVSDIKQAENITIVTFDAQGKALRMMALGLNLPLYVGTRVVLGFKASHVSLSVGLTDGLSISNRLDAVVETVETGALLCSVMLRVGRTRVESIITRESAERMELLPGSSVRALIKASDLSVLSVVSKGAQ
jgi:molybdopterin-binding protein